MDRESELAFKAIAAIAIRVAYAFGPNEGKMNPEKQACDNADRLVNEIKQRGWDLPK